MKTCVYKWKNRRYLKVNQRSRFKRQMRHHRKSRAWFNRRMADIFQQQLLDDIYRENVLLRYLKRKSRA